MAEALDPRAESGWSRAPILLNRDSRGISGGRHLAARTRRAIPAFAKHRRAARSHDPPRPPRGSIAKRVI